MISESALGKMFGQEEQLLCAYYSCYFCLSTQHNILCWKFVAIMLETCISRDHPWLNIKDSASILRHLGFSDKMEDSSVDRRFLFGILLGFLSCLNRTLKYHALRRRRCPLWRGIVCGRYLWGGSIRMICSKKRSLDDYLSWHFLALRS